MGGKVSSPEAIARRKVRNLERMRNRPIEVQRQYDLARTLRNHHISLDRFNTLWESQQGSCPVCKRPLLLMVGRTGDGTHIDHDHHCCPGTHSCGNCIRGLLHAQCNIAIGGLEDNPTRCRNAAEYLEAYYSQKG